MEASRALIVTGAGGFVGRALCARVGAAAVRLPMSRPGWQRDAAALAFEGATIVHLAARAHADASEEEMRRDNADKTGALAQLAAARGARRFVLLSSAKVHGEESLGRPFAPDDPPRPEDAYARSKAAAEEALRLAAGSALETVLLRSPLVYGAGAAGNLAALVRLADSPWPLPFAALENRRSFIHVDDLAVAIEAAARVPEAAGRTYLVAHRDPVSTRALVAAIRARLGRPRRLFPLAPAALEAAAAVIGRAAHARRLTRSLEVDPSRAEVELRWHATRSFESSVEDLVAGYRRESP